MQVCHDAPSRRPMSNDYYMPTAFIPGVGCRSACVQIVSFASEIVRGLARIETAT